MATPIIAQSTLAIHPKQHSVTLRPKQFATLAAYAELSGVSVEDQVREALSDFIHCSIAARASDILEEQRRIERSLRRSLQKVEIDECLQQLEADLTPAPSPDAQAK